MSSTDPTLRASLIYMRMRGRTLERDFTLYLGGDSIACFTTIDKKFAHIDWHRDTEQATRDAIGADLLESLALNG